MIKKILIIWLLISTSATPFGDFASYAFAANHCIREGGSGDGTDWINALDDLPASLTRGDTYYIADGNYSGNYTFDDALSGTTYIYIKKATIANHGVTTNWNDVNGDGVAYIDVTANNQRWEFHTSYYDINGVSGGGPGSWKTGHGFKFKMSSDDLSINISYKGFIVLGNGWSNAYLPHHIKIQHCEMTTEDAGNANNDGDQLIFHSLDDSTPGLVDEDYANGPNNITISYCYLHDVCMMIKSVICQNWLLEYNWFARNDTIPNTTNQGEAWKAFGDDGHVIRYNVFEDIDGTGILVPATTTGNSDIFEPNNWEIYGNIFFYNATQAQPFNGLGGDGAIAGTQTSGHFHTGFKIYNNTFVNLWGNNCGIGFNAVGSSNNLIYDNIWYDCNSRGNYAWFTGVTHNYNWFADCLIGYVNEDVSLTAAEADGQHGSGNPFTNIDANDFTLTAETAAGTNLGSPYNVDMLGETRTDWTRGAYEYVAGSVSCGCLWNP